MEELITLCEAASRLGVHISTLRSWVREGRLPAYRLGARFTRVSWRALLRALDATAVERESRESAPREGEAQVYEDQR
jgi:excisionase family DNA binding protein